MVDLSKLVANGQNRSELAYIFCRSYSASAVRKPVPPVQLSRVVAAKNRHQNTKGVTDGLISECRIVMWLRIADESSQARPSSCQTSDSEKRGMSDNGPNAKRTSFEWYECQSQLACITSEHYSRRIAFHQSFSDVH